MPDPAWIEQLKDYLCRIYREWGGDCANLPFSVSQQIQLLHQTYAAQGAPTLGSELQRQAYLQLLTDCVAHLNGQENSLSPDDDAYLRALISDLESDVGAGGS